MTTQMCELCSAAVTGIDNNNSNSDNVIVTSSSPVLKRIFCIRPTPDEIRKYLTKKAISKIEKFNNNSGAIYVDLPEETIKKLIDTIFDVDEYNERASLCIGQYAHEFDSILQFMTDNALSYGQLVAKFTIALDSSMGLVSLEKSEENTDKPVSVGRKYYIRKYEKRTKKIVSSSSLSSSSSSSLSKQGLANTIIKSHRLPQLSNTKLSQLEEGDSSLGKNMDQKRYDCISQFIDEGTDEFDLVIDNDTFTLADDFNEIFKQYQNKKFKPYCLRQSDRIFLQKHGFDWKNLNLCHDCQKTKRKECKCLEKTKERISVIDNLKIVISSSKISKNSSSSRSVDPRKAVITNTIINNNNNNNKDVIKPIKEKRLTKEGKNSTKNKIITNTTTGDAMHKFHCQFPDCSFKTNSPSQVKDHFKMKAKTRPPIASKSELNRIYRLTINRPSDDDNNGNRESSPHHDSDKDSSSDDDYVPYFEDYNSSECEFSQDDNNLKDTVNKKKRKREDDTVTNDNIHTIEKSGNDNSNVLIKKVKK
jgi:hypothetical protein